MPISHFFSFHCNRRSISSRHLMVNVTERFLEDYACSSYGRGSHAQRCGTECHSEPEYKFCCLKMGFCNWYQSWWFIWVSVSATLIILFLSICLLCWCCSRSRRRY
ncbi:hypothetical protein GCK72_011833 [Caenorhabditis remanei]|uniref:Uncharacterized protein n=1 Tax=Caenorhabditis remanei TaxID=31234 RepID=A0A6A5H8L9_CAERE|nr:hypothetical protein GCK72_011833 [Caenorhabditis remanei]KAF1763567.1 hypothetical protein GCK72_011833 [Caenorhabditis remanei]